MLSRQTLQFFNEGEVKPVRKRKLEDLPELPSPMKYFYSKKNKLCIAAQKKCGKKMMRRQLQIEQMLDD